MSFTWCCLRRRRDPRSADATTADLEKAASFEKLATSPDTCSSRNYACKKTASMPTHDRSPPAAGPYGPPRLGHWDAFSGVGDPAAASVTSLPVQYGQSQLSRWDAFEGVGDPEARSLPHKALPPPAPLTPPSPGDQPPQYMPPTSSVPSSLTLDGSTSASTAPETVPEEQPYLGREVLHNDKRGTVLEYITGA
jgi:hypothetical protein